MFTERQIFIMRMALSYAQANLPDIASAFEPDGFEAPDAAAADDISVNGVLGKIPDYD
jgi:hypothetical protein